MSVSPPNFFARRALLAPLAVLSSTAYAAPYIDIVTPTQLISYDLGNGAAREGSISYEFPSSAEGYSVVGLDWEWYLDENHQWNGDGEPWVLAKKSGSICRIFTGATADDDGPEDGDTVPLEAAGDEFACPGATAELEVFGAGDLVTIVTGDQAIVIQYDEDEGGTLGLTVEGQPANILGAADMSEEIFGVDRFYAVDSMLNALIDYSDAVGTDGGPAGDAVDGQIVGSLGVTLSGNTSFDIGLDDGEPLAVLLSGGKVYRVDLATGGSTLLFDAPEGAIAASVEPFDDDGDGGGGDGGGDGGGGGGGGGGGSDDDDDDDGGAFGLTTVLGLGLAAVLRRRRRWR